MSQHLSLKYLLLLAFLQFLTLQLLTTHAYIINIESFNPTYLQFCLSDAKNSSQVFTNVQIMTYDWETNIENPVLTYYPMQNYAKNCYYLGAPTNAHIFFLPATVKFSINGNEQVELKNIISQMSVMKIDTSTVNQTISHANELKIPIANQTFAYQTVVTYFTPNAGACQLNPIPTEYATMYAAIRVQDWSTSRVCGQCLRLCNATGHSVEVLVTDMCPFPNLCTRYNWLDISDTAFNYLSGGNLGWGVQQLTWRFVQCTKFKSSTPSPNMSFLFTDYSRNYGFELQVRNFNIGLKSVDIQSKVQGNWISLNRTEGNTWLYTTGNVITCPCRVRLTSISGQVVIDENAVNQDIGSLPKKPEYLNTTVQFDNIPSGYESSNSCIPSVFNPITPITSTNQPRGSNSSRMVNASSTHFINGFIALSCLLLFFF
ncbi:predicted protein [Naegleria gruberi]|uniref:Predicted protein n=1 Tax=Naegleria gruberi TaxID=5762 RepID=D2VCF8_NAEGR|nr:uncharacterized protein NAEGRDRAFT_66556 [Naegleria gruberi]EFC45298.1 predicted protein [Naegleria gruberi]|eukprot:XP_002678042.1 predicted protein [Naegleria gruberi strain NEG-M]